MARDFLDGLSETLSRTAREFSERAENVYEVQKVRNKMRTEERQKEKALFRLGLLMYQRFCEGEAVDEEIEEICEEIQKHEKAAASYAQEVSKAKGEKKCPSCGKFIPGAAAFCQYCGSSCEKETASVKEYEETGMEQTSEDAFEEELIVE